MPLSAKDALDVVQAVATIVTPITILLTVRQLNAARQQNKQQSDNAAVDFVLNAEGQFDGAYDSLVSGASEATIRLAFSGDVDPSWNADELRAFVYLFRFYGHVSRMVYIVNDKTINIGMDDADRREFLYLWERGLEKYSSNPIMQRIHRNALRNKDYNSHMIKLSRRIFDKEH